MRLAGRLFIRSYTTQASFLRQRSANHTALTPLTFLERTASVFPSLPAVVYDDWKSQADVEKPPAYQQNWGETFRRCKQLASGLVQQGVLPGDIVAVLAPNVPAFFEAHHGVNMAGGVINPINTRLDPAALAYILAHGNAKVLLFDAELSKVTQEAVETLRSQGVKPPVLVRIDDPVIQHSELDRNFGSITYNELLGAGDPEFKWVSPTDEWETQALSYTSGTTGQPKGVLYHHRGTALNAINNSLVWGIGQHPTYLWTLPMFHCSGWCFPYTITLQAGTHVCLRSVDSASIFNALASQRVSHMCGAPIVMNMLIHASQQEQEHWSSACQVRAEFGLSDVQMFTAGAPPPAAVIEKMEKLGFEITHVYGLTEVYGPAVSCAWNHQEWSALGLEEAAERKARQGVRYPLLEDLCVVQTDASTPASSDGDAQVDSYNSSLPEGWRHVTRDGKSIGEIMMRGNVVMKGYLHDEAATEQAFEGGWFHSGDLAVVHEDGYIEIKDRKKDIIISGGENISTVEVESVLFRHPAILEASVVARPDDKWGETPCAFVQLKEGYAWEDRIVEGVDQTTEQNIIEFCRAYLAHFKAPKTVVHLPNGLPKTSTGKVQKFVLRTDAANL